MIDRAQIRDGPRGQGHTGPIRHLTAFDAICIVLGIVIGAGIFKTPGLVASSTSYSTVMMLAWFLGGFFCLCAAFTYTELACAYPCTGGEYTYLRKSFGGAVSFLFVWARITVIQTGSIAALAYIFGDYAMRILPLPSASPLHYALGSTAILTGVNTVGLQSGKWTQNLLTLLKVGGVLTIIAAGLLSPQPLEGGAPSPAPAGRSGFGLAMVFVLWTFGGWNEAAYVAGEVRNERSNMLRVLVGSIVALTLLYVAVNFAYLRVLGFEGMRESSAVAADVMHRLLGGRGSSLVSLLVAISALGAMNGCIFTGARSLNALGTDWRVLQVLGRWHQRLRTPANAVLAQGLGALCLVLLPGLGAGFRKALGTGFEAAVEYTAPVYWAFLLLTGVALFVLRARAPALERPFRVPFYPATVLLYCLMCSYMLYSSLVYTRAGALVGVAVLLCGIPLYALCRSRSEKAANSDD